MEPAKETNEGKVLLPGKENQGGNCATKRQGNRENAAPEKKPRILRENDSKIWAAENNAASNQSAVDRKAIQPNGQSQAQSNGQSNAHSNSQSNGYSNGQSNGHSFGQSHDHFNGQLEAFSNGQMDASCDAHFDGRNRSRYPPNPWANGENRGRYRGPQRNDEFQIMQRLRSIAGSTIDIECKVYEEFKFSCRNRLYIGNMNVDMTEEKLRELFKPFGEISDVFIVAEKSFAFAKFDYHINAEKAKRALDSSNVGGRMLRVRFAKNQSVVRVGNLSSHVSNELLHKSFEIFGPVERATITVDERGSHMGEGTVEFVTKATAWLCMRMCKENCYFITASLRPCIAEPIDLIDVDNDGVPERTISKTAQYKYERGVGPRFADLDSFDHEYGCKWKEVYAIYQAKLNTLKRDLKLEEERLDAQMEYVCNERETEILRLELRQREADNERRKLEFEMRQKQCHEFQSASYRRFKTEPQNYVPDNSSGFGSICEYSARSASFEGNPFVVFPDHVSNERENDMPPAAGFIEGIRLEDNEDNAFWSRRSI